MKSANGIGPRRAISARIAASAGFSAGSRCVPRGHRAPPSVTARAPQQAQPGPDERVPAEEDRDRGLQPRPP